MNLDLKFTHEVKARRNAHKQPHVERRKKNKTPKDVPNCGSSSVSYFQGRAAFQECEESFLNKIRLAAINRNVGTLVVAQNDDVFYIPEDTKTPLKMKPFCESIKEVFQNRYGFFVITNNMKLYVSNDLRLSNAINFVPIYTDLKIKQFSCGNRHGAILTTKGKIWCFHLYNIKKSIIEPCYTSASSTWTYVACGNDFTASIDNNGQLYVWIPQVVFDNAPKFIVDEIKSKVTSNMSTRTPILPNEQIKQVVCGFRHVLALSTSGKMYTFGNNDCGQLGLKNKQQQNFPAEITIIKQKMIEIGSSLEHPICCSLTEDNKVYVWGEFRAKHLLQPNYYPELSSLLDVNNTLEYTNITLERETPQATGEGPSSLTAPWQGDLLENLIDTEGYDFTIIVKGRTIRVLKYILIQRSNYFQALFGSNWKENESKSMDVQEYPYDLYMIYLKYLYSGKLNVPPKEAMDLYRLADCYLEIDLKQLCCSILLRNMGATNVVDIYKNSVIFNDKAMEDGSLNFIKTNFNELLRTKKFSGNVLLEVMNKITSNGKLSVHFG